MEAHRNDPALPAVLNLRCWARALGGIALDEALADCNRAVQGTRGAPATLDSRGLVHLRRGDYAAAVADYDAALAKEANLTWSLYGHGLARLKLGQLDAGRVDMAAAAKMRPALPERARRRGLVPGSTGTVTPA